jgi:cleavage stimulation factor subunit 3
MNFEEEEDTEENEPLVILPKDIKDVQCTDEFTESKITLQHDCWDLQAWMTFLEEAEKGNGGPIDFKQAYTLFLEKFPRAGKFWKRLADLLFLSGQEDEAFSTLHLSTRLCWDISLWEYYLDLLIAKKISTSNYNLSEEFEYCLDRLGTSFLSGSIWKKYIQFRLQTLENDISQLHSIRLLFLRAISIPLENSDSLLAEYEKFERSHSDHNSENTLSEAQKRFLHAKSILKERRKFVSEISFDRLSLPPTDSPTDIMQLQKWNNWIR